MEVFHQLGTVDLRGRRTSVAIGNFDGVHLGHVALLDGMLSYARATGTVPSVLTFYPHPVEVLRPTQVLERLTTASEKLGLLESRGVELVLVAPFDAALAALPPSDFFQRFLGEGLCAQSIHVGFNFRFGKGRAGDTGTLASLADPHQIRLQVVPAVERDGVKVSSSSIRQALRDGEVTRAASWLGRPYSLSGQVAQGDRRGHQLGFPTANLRYAHDKLLPKNGVYVTEAIWQKQRFTSVTNIGVRPTFAGAATPGRLVEVHVLDFHSRLYDEFIEIEFHQRLRDERKFDSIDDLKAQIGRDCEQARAWGAGRA